MKEPRPAKGLEQAYLSAAIENYTADNIQFDEYTEYSPAEGGFWVKGWCWVSNEQAFPHSGE